MLDKTIDFLRNEAGNYAVIAAACAMPLFAAAGLAVDYSRITRTQTKIQQTADAAVLAAVRDASDRLAAGDSEKKAFAEARKIGEALFEANMRMDNDSYAGAFRVSIVRTADGIKGTAQWKGRSAGTLLAAVGLKDSDITIDAQALIGSGSFIELHFLVDTSASMGVGAAPSDHQIMANTIGCAFACHVPANSVYWRSTIGEARSAGATLRIDAVKAAIGTMLDDLAANNLSGNSLRVSIHTFSNRLTTRLQPTTNATDIRKAVAQIELDGSEGQTGTNFSAALSALQAKLPVSGDGSSAKSRKVYAVLLTDGVATNVMYKSGVNGEYTDDPAFAWYSPVYNGNGAWAMQGFDPAACTGIKTVKKAELMTLNIRYTIPKVGTDNDGRFNEIGTHLAPKIATNMETCASAPDYALWADTPASIHDAMSKLAGMLGSSTLRLAN